MVTMAAHCAALEDHMARPEVTGRKCGAHGVSGTTPHQARAPPKVSERSIAGKKLLTFDDLVALGHPYTRQHTKRLEDAGRFPLRVRPGGEASNFVCWIASEYFDYLERLAAARPAPSTRRPPPPTNSEATTTA
jgi:hypothetical protein